MIFPKFTAIKTHCHETVKKAMMITTIMTQISKDNDSVLTDKMLSQFTAAQIFSMLDLAAGNAARCTARLLDYRNRCLPKFADINEFSLDW